MEYQYITLYQGVLQECHISTVENLVFISNGEFFRTIGKFKNEGIIEGGLPLLKIYQYTGKETGKGDKIYEGHRIRIPTFKMPGVVLWNQEKAGFYLDFGLKHLYQFEDVYCESFDMELLGHISQDHKNGVTA